MNFTDSPYERMMKQVPRPSRHDPEPCPDCRERGGCKKKRRTLIVEPRRTSGQVGPKLSPPEMGGFFSYLGALPPQPTTHFEWRKTIWNFLLLLSTP